MTEYKYIRAPKAGEYIVSFAQELAAYVNSQPESVTVFEWFNGSRVTATTGQSAEEIYDAWVATFDKDAQAWRDSKEGQESLQKQAALATERKQAAIEYIAELEAVDLRDLCQIMSLLGAAPVILGWENTAEENRKFIELLQSAGYEKDANLNLVPEAYSDPEVMARYIIGQAMSDIGPHDVLSKFVAEWVLIFGGPCADKQ